MALACFGTSMVKGLNLIPSMVCVPPIPVLTIVTCVLTIDGLQKRKKKQHEYIVITK